MSRRWLRGHPAVQNVQIEYRRRVIFLDCNARHLYLGQRAQHALQRLALRADEQQPAHGPRRFDERHAYVVERQQVGLIQTHLDPLGSRRKPRHHRLPGIAGIKLHRLPFQQLVVPEHEHFLSNRAIAVVAYPDKGLHRPGGVPAGMNGLDRLVVAAPGAAGDNVQPKPYWWPQRAHRKRGVGEQIDVATSRPPDQALRDRQTFC